MLEAVNSVLQTAPLVRASSEQISTVDSYAANPERVQRSAPQAPFVSPYIYMDVRFDKAVIQLRNGDTGDVEDQFPSEAALQAQARQRAQRQVELENATPAPQVQEQSAQAVVQKTGASGGTDAEDNASKEAAISAQQQAAFAAAARSGNTNAGNITLFA